MINKREMRYLQTRLKRVLIAAEEADDLVALILDYWESGPESCREENAPALSGGDKSTVRLVAV